MREPWEEDRLENAVGERWAEQGEDSMEQDRRAAWPSPLLRGPDGQNRNPLACSFEELPTFSS
jgi:hypothetical protein